jgi:hypothetical protein
MPRRLGSSFERSGMIVKEMLPLLLIRDHSSGAGEFSRVKGG